MAMFYKTRNNAIKFYDDYSTMTYEAKNEPTKGKGLKILTPKQIIERNCSCTSKSIIKV